MYNIVNKHKCKFCYIYKFWVRFIEMHNLHQEAVTNWIQFEYSLYQTETTCLQYFYFYSKLNLGVLCNVMYLCNTGANPPWPTLHNSKIQIFRICRKYLLSSAIQWFFYPVHDLQFQWIANAHVINFSKAGATVCL